MRPLGKDMMTNIYFESQIEKSGSFIFKKFVKYKEFIHLSDILRYIYMFIAVYYYHLWH